jgi:FtsP/CotA-like multicopper oxidase with cupredoxin domain
MKPLQTARLLGVFSLSAVVTLLVNCQKADVNQTPEPQAKAGEPVCSTITQSKTKNCTLESGANGSNTLNYSLTASRQAVNIPVENGSQPALTMNDALVYNDSLIPERLELRRGDELRISFKNMLTMPADGRFDALGSHDPAENLPDMKPQFSNLHTHGLVTAWDFKDNKNGRGDNVLGILLDSKQQQLPAGVNPADVCSTTGDSVPYRYPILPDHEIGLNWYHPHPHGTSGFQLEGGMSGLLMVGDEQAEKLLNPVYLQLKDMQSSKQQAANTYQFEKFVPAVATICHDKTSDDEWAFDSDTPGRCDYHSQASKQAYSWLFLVNGQLFPSVDVPKAAYLRIANSSANATYRLVLEPDAAQQQKPGTEQTYYTPPFKVVEKDGMTTIDKSLTDAQQVCTLAMTPATRVGVAVDFEAMAATGSACELKVVVTEKDGNKTVSYDVKHTVLDDSGKKKLAAQAKIASYNLTQEGIDTGEDDWPAVRLAKLTPNDKLHGVDLDAYQLALKNAKKPTNVAHEDVRVPDDACTPTQPVADKDGVNRHLALFYGGTEPDAQGEFTKEHFGLVAAGELNEGAPVTADTIQKWRVEYQSQFADPAKAGQSYNSDKKLQEYGVPNLVADALKGLVSHKFRIEKTGVIKTNVCTQTSHKPERWRVHNLSAQIHNFHIHQMKFHVVGVKGAACTLPPQGDTPVNAFRLVDKDGYLPENVGDADLVEGMDEQCVKSYAELFHNVPASFKLVERLVPVGTTGAAAAPMAMTARVKPVEYGMHDTFPVPPMGYIDIDVLFDKPEQVGEYVFHCHILEHEDAGMMGKLVVKPGV